VQVGTGARLSVVVDDVWRASALADMIREAGLVPEITRTDENTPLVRTAIDPLLRGVAAEWTRGAVKTVPPRWLPGPRELRAWTLAAGSPEADRYLLGLDPHAPDTHSPLASALMRVGDCTDPDRHSRHPAGAANRRPSPAIAPGRERGGPPRQCRGIGLVAQGLAARRATVSRRPVCAGPPIGAKLSVARTRRYGGVPEFSGISGAELSFFPAGAVRLGGLLKRYVRDGA
jgi:hypothetical protein